MVPRGGSDGRTCATCLSNSVMSGSLRPGMSSNRLSTLTTAMARSPKTAIFDRFKSSSVSLQRQREFDARRAHDISKPDLQVGVRTDRVRNLHVDLVESGEAGRDAGIKDEAGV